MFMMNGDFSKTIVRSNTLTCWMNLDIRPVLSIPQLQISFIRLTILAFFGLKLIVIPYSSSLPLYVLSLLQFYLPSHSKARRSLLPHKKLQISRCTDCDMGCLQLTPCVKRPKFLFRPFRFVLKNPHGRNALNGSLEQFQNRPIAQ